MPAALQYLNAQQNGPPIELLLTDLHPDPGVVHSFNAGADERVHYHAQPVDATEFDSMPAGLKTMVNSFHHMPPEVARKILFSAQANRQPLLIYEMAENKIPNWLWWLLLPLSLLILVIMTLFMTPFVRPLTAHQLLFTYLIPVIPLVYAWDGQASLVRLYGFKDMRQLLPDADTDAYHWEMGHGTTPTGKKLGYYLLGLPR